MANPWDNDPVVSGIDAALAKEGVTGKRADFFKSIYQQESGSGKNTTTSNAGAVGGAQIIPSTFKSVAEQGWDINNPEHNLRAGIRYAMQGMDKSGDNPAKAAAYYYGGPGGLAKAEKGIAVADPRNPKAPNTLQYGQQVASRMGAAQPVQGNPWDNDPVVSLDKPTVQLTQQPVAQQPTKEDPTGSFGQNLAAGIGKFASDTARGGKQLLDDSAAYMEGLAPNASKSINNFLGLDSAKNIQTQGRNAIEETRKLDAPLMKTGGGIVGYGLGGLMTAPVMPAINTVKGAATAGGALGLTQPATSWAERGTNTATGAAIGGVGQVGANALSRIINPQTSPEIKTLMQQGVTPTPGQILGGGFRRAEDAMTSVPILGDSIKSAQRRAIEDVNTAAYNRALNPIGESLPKNTMGRDAVEYTYEKLGDAYKALLPKMSTKADAQFSNDVSAIKNMVNQGAIDPNSVNAFNKILDNKLLGKFQGKNSISGQTLKDIESNLTSEIQRFARSTDSDQRLIGDALKEMQSNLRGLVTRSNPANAEELSAINQGYANFKRIQKAASSLGAENGIFTPAQLQNAVKAADKSKDKARFSEGNALMQDLSESAKNALSSKVPDSGTPYRTLMGLIGVGAGHAAIGPVAPAAVAGGMAAYSKPGQEAIARLLTSRPEYANKLAQILRSSGPYIGQGSAAMAIEKNSP